MWSRMAPNENFKGKRRKKGYNIEKRRGEGKGEGREHGGKEGKKKEKENGLNMTYS